MRMGRVVGSGLAAVFLTGTTLLAQVQPYLPPDGRSGGQPQAFMPQDFRINRAPAAVAPDTRTGWSDHRTAPQDSRPQAGQVPMTQPVDYRTVQPATRLPQQAPPVYLPQQQAAPAYLQQQAPQPVIQHPYQQAIPQAITEQPGARSSFIGPPDSRPRALPGVVAREFAVSVDQRPGVQDTRSGVIDPRIVVPREERYIDYRPIEGRPYDFRPVDYKPVDSRAIEYRSFDNKVQDQKVLDPRLKEKGPEIQTRLECKAILYRAVECNYLDYKEIDPKLQDLYAKYPEVTLGIVPQEYAKNTTERWASLMAFLSQEIGLKVSLKIANDYQSLIESQREGLIHLAIYSPMAYARARTSGVKVEAFAVETNGDGSRGRYSMIYAMSRGAIPKVEDFRNRSLALVDPNSVSGYSVPRHALAAQKVDPDSVLSRQVFTGSHENALVALSQGLVDYAVGEWTSDEDSTLGRLLARGALKNVDGTPMRRDDFRVVMKSDIILNSPVVYLADLPEDLKGIIRRAMLEAPMRDRASFERVFDGKIRSWETIDNAAFDGTLDLVRYIDDARRNGIPQKQAAR